ncbi:MAG: sodium:proton antiporter NhaD [Candidatus Kapaibacterium sp.]
MTTIFLILIFALGYLAIAFEQRLRLNKAASALLTGVLCWLVYFLDSDAPAKATDQLIHHIGEISSVLFFLLGAMTIVELIDSHGGFDIISEKISTKSLPKLLVIIALFTFFLSSLLDNLTTAIIMTSLCAKILDQKEDRLWFAGMIIIAANAGGAWSPLGDVTTSMLWIGGQVTALNLMKMTYLPSIIVCLVPLFIIGRKFKGKKLSHRVDVGSRKSDGSIIILFSGLGFLLFVPIFKSMTNLPPFMGMMLALGLMWIITSVIHYKKLPEEKDKYSVSYAVQKIDIPSILFFLGILLAVSALESQGLLKIFASYLESILGNNYSIGTVLGLFSGIIDNVPLVAASQGMFSLVQFPTDHYFWEFIALTTGTGGSIIIIGSAAGVAAMGIESIDFLWYLKKISWVALIGFACGIVTFILQQTLTVQ